MHRYFLRSIRQREAQTLPPAMYVQYVCTVGMRRVKKSKMRRPVVFALFLTIQMAHGKLTCHKLQRKRFRGRRFIDVNTTASKNVLTSHIIIWRIFVYIYPRTNSTKLWRISCAAPATLPPLHCPKTKERKFNLGVLNLYEIHFIASFSVKYSYSV
jgi:hypothetical protein